MKKIAVALALVLSSAVGYSQCMATSVSARKEMHQSAFVIVGTVTAVHQVPEVWDFLDGTAYTVRVDSVIHGKTDRAVYTIFSENIPNAFSMDLGKHYVLYVHPQYDRYEVDNCGNSHPTELLEASIGRDAAKGD